MTPGTLVLFLFPSPWKSRSPHFKPLSDFGPSPGIFKYLLGSLLHSFYSSLLKRHLLSETPSDNSYKMFSDHTILNLALSILILAYSSSLHVLKPNQPNQHIFIIAVVAKCKFHNDSNCVCFAHCYILSI